MSWNFLISFGIGLACYLLVLLVVFLVKKHKYKKSFDKETKEKVEGHLKDEQEEDK